MGRGEGGGRGEEEGKEEGSNLMQNHKGFMFKSASLLLLS